MSFTSLLALAGRKERFKKIQVTQFKFFTLMDPTTNESRPVTSETMVLINRSSLTNWLEQAYDEYDKCWRHGDKVNALVWDGFIRAYHRCLDAEVTD